MMTTNSEEMKIIPGMEDWRLLPLKSIISTKKQSGLLPISATTFLGLVKKGLAPQGKKIESVVKRML